MQGCKGAQRPQIPQACPADASVFYYAKLRQLGFADARTLDCF